MADRLARPHDAPALPLPTGRPLELVHSPLGRTTETADGDRRRAARAPARPRPSGPTRASSRSDQGEWQGLHRDEIEARYGADAGDLAALARSRRGRPAASHSPRSRHGSRPALRAMLERLADGRPPGTHDRSAGRGLRRSAARPSVVDRGRSRRRVQGRAADPVRPAARSLLDVVDGPVRDQRRRAARRATGPARLQPDGAPRRPWRMPSRSQSSTSARTAARCSVRRRPASSAPDRSAAGGRVAPCAGRRAAGG